jgi:hypothetical protein
VRTLSRSSHVTLAHFLHETCNQIVFCTVCVRLRRHNPVWNVVLWNVSTCIYAPTETFLFTPRKCSSPASHGISLLVAHPNVPRSSPYSWVLCYK